MEEVIKFDRVYSDETNECTYLVEQSFYPIHYNPLKDDNYISLIVDRNETTSNVIDIDYLQKYLENARLSGATHVAIEYHIDHDTYLIEGFKTSNN